MESELNPNGAYEISRTNSKIKLTILSTGSEVDLAISISHKLAKYKLYSKVISVPSLELFKLQSNSYKNKILNETKFKFSIEAASTDPWKQLIVKNLVFLKIRKIPKTQMVVLNDRVINIPIGQ